VTNQLALFSDEQIVPVTELESTRNSALKCTGCELADTRNKVVFGEGNHDRPPIMFIGEAPGAREDETGRPFVGRAGQLGRNLYTKMTQGPTPAQKIVVDRLRQGGFTPDQLDDALTKIGPDAGLADVAQPARDLGRAVHALPGKGREYLDETLTQRTAGSYNRIMKSLKKSAGTDKEFFSSVKQVIDRRAAESSRFYRPAMDDVVPEERVAQVVQQIDDILPDAHGTPIGSALNSAKRMMFEGKEGPLKTKVSQLHMVQKSLRDKVSSMYRSNNPERARVIQKIHRSLLDVMDDASPDYKMARGIYASDSAVKDAMELGRKVLREDAVDMYMQTANFSKGEKDAFIIGAVKAVRDKIAGSKLGTDPSRRLATVTLRERLINVFPDDVSLKNFLNTLDAENAMAQTKNYITAGSQTAEKMQSANAVRSIWRGMTALLRRRPGQSAAEAANLIWQRKDIPEYARHEIAKLVTSPKAGQDIVKLMRKYGISNREARDWIIEMHSTLLTGAVASQRDINRELGEVLEQY